MKKLIIKLLSLILLGITCCNQADFIYRGVYVEIAPSVNTKKLRDEIRYCIDTYERNLHTSLDGLTLYVRTDYEDIYVGRYLPEYHVAEIDYKDPIMLSAIWHEFLHHTANVESDNSDHDHENQLHWEWEKTFLKFHKKGERI